MILIVQLQWGRDLVIAEIWAHGKEYKPVTQLQWGRDLVIAEIAISAFASLCCSEVLQWGRDLVIAEMGHGLVDSGEVGRLQWGRDLVIAEIAALPPPPDGFDGFNGAAIW